VVGLTRSGLDADRVGGGYQTAINRALRAYVEAREGGYPRFDRKM